MGAHGIGLVASAVPVGGTIALVLLLALGVLALHVARKVSAAREPMFPDLAVTAPDPAAFARELAAGGNLADDAARFTDVAHRSGVQQAYALLALVNTDAPGAGTFLAEDAPPSTAIDPFGSLADLAPARAGEPIFDDAPRPTAADPFASLADLAADVDRAAPVSAAATPAFGVEARAAVVPDSPTPDVDAAAGRVERVAADRHDITRVHPDDTLLPGRRHARRRRRAA